MPDDTHLLYGSHKIRTGLVHGQTGYVLQDICRILGNTRATNVATQLDKTDKALIVFQTKGGKQKLLMVTAKGLQRILETSRATSAPALMTWLHSTLRMPETNDADTTHVVPYMFGDNKVRTATLYGKPAFAVADVCVVLGHNNPTRAVQRLEGGQKGLITSKGSGAPLAINFVTESGLYMLIMTSRKPAAKRFALWVTEEVLPAIRQTGHYSTDARRDHQIETQGVQTLKAFVHAVYDTSQEVGAIGHKVEAFKEVVHWISAAIDRIRTRTKCLGLEEQNYEDILKNRIQLLKDLDFAHVVRDDTRLEAKEAQIKDLETRLAAAYKEMDYGRNRERELLDTIHELLKRRLQSELVDSKMKLSS